MSRLFPDTQMSWNGTKSHPRAASPDGGNAGDRANSNEGEKAVQGPGRDLTGATSLAGAIDLEFLQAENAALRTTIGQLEKQMAEAARLAEESLAERQKEYESLLEEKSEVIRILHRKLQEVLERPIGATPREDELLALSEELERERRQLKEDEESLTAQMRDMEVQMSKERAELARQGSELLRLQSELRHELALAGRDAALRERLAPLQRRHQELTNRRGSGPPPDSAQAPPKARDTPDAPAEAPPPKRKESGLFSRLFG